MSDDEDVNLSEESDFSASESEYNPESDSGDSEQEISADSSVESSEGSDDERDESFKAKKRPPPKRGQKTRKSLTSSFRDKTVNAYRNAAKKFTSNPNVSNNLKDILLRAQLKNKKKLSSSQSRQSSNEEENDPPNFDCSGGVRLSDSESDEESSSNQITLPKKSLTNEEPKKKSNPIINSINEASGSAINMSKILQNLQEVEKTTEQLKNMQSNAISSEKEIDTMNISQLLALGEGSGSAAKASKRKHVESDDSDEWEEVEAAATQKSKVPIQGIEITITSASGRDKKEKTKKEVDEDLCMRRQFNRQRKEHQVFLHKVNLICWIGHGNFVNPILNNTSLMAQCLAMLPKNNNHCYPKEKTNAKYFQQVTEFFRREITLQNREMYCKMTKRPHLMQSLALQIKTKTAICRRDFILIYIVLLRAIGIQCRMVQSLNMAPLRPPQSELLSLSTKNDKGKKEKKKNDEEGSITKYSTYSSSKSCKNSSKAGSSSSSKKSKKSADLLDLSENLDDDEEMNEVVVKRTSRSRQPAKTTEVAKKSSKSSKKSSENDDKENAKKSKKVETSTVSTRTRSHNSGRTPLLPQFDGADDVPKKSHKPLKIRALKGFEVNMSQSFVNLSGDDSPRASSSKASRTKKVEEKNLKASPKKLRSRSKSSNSVDNKAKSSKSSSADTKVSKRAQKTENHEVKIKSEDQGKMSPEKSSNDGASTSQDKKPNLANLKKHLNNSAEKVTKISQEAEISKDSKKSKVSGKSNEAEKSKNSEKSQETEKPKDSGKSKDAEKEKITKNSKAPANSKKNDNSEKQEKNHLKVNAGPSPKKTRSKSTETKEKSSSKPNLSKLKETKEKPKETEKPKTAMKRKAKNDDEAGPSEPKKSKIDSTKRVSFAGDSKAAKKPKTSKSNDDSFAEESGEESEDDSLKYFNLKKVKPGSTTPKSVVSKLKARDRRILSTDLDESVMDRDEEKSKKSGIDIWVELYSEEDEKWIPVDVFKGKVNCVPELCKAATHPITYVFAWNNDNTIKDVSPRYCPNFNTSTRKLRVEREYLDSILKTFIGRPSARDKKEDAEFTQTQFDKPLPTSISDFKNHPLYALKRHLLKFEAIYPPDAPTVGFIREEPIYPRDCVFTLHSREVWVKQARVVRAFEEPYKIVTARPKWDRATNSMKTDIPLEIFGIWQTDEYEPPTAENGIVPRNAYGNVELFKACMLPKKTVHLQLPGLNRVCKKLNIDCAQAMVGFDFHGGSSHPVFDGFVICEEFAEKVVDAWNRDQDEMEQREQDKIDKRIYGNWKKLIKGLLIRERLKNKYNF